MLFTSEMADKFLRAKEINVDTMFIVGKSDIEANAISIRVHGKGNLGAKPRTEAIADVLQAIKTRQA